MRFFQNHYSFRDSGLLILRIGIGAMFMIHGLPKMLGGAEQWAKVGKAMSYLGIDQYPELWGYLAAFAELGGGMLLIFGILHRPVCFVLFFAMVVASMKHIGQGDEFTKASHAIEAGILFFAWIFIGPGRFSLDEKIFGNSRSKYAAKKDKEVKEN